MRHTSFFNASLAVVIMVATLTLMAGGFAQAKTSVGHAATPMLHLAEGFFITTEKGEGDENSPASGSSHFDFNPRCGDTLAIPTYRPNESLLTLFEPFTPIPQVFPDRFIPPQSHGL